MASAAAKFPDDVDVLALVSLMDRSPWDYWEAGGAIAKPVVAPLVQILETVLRRDPNHIGAIHLYIHTVEASANPKRAEPYADKEVGQIAAHVLRPRIAQATNDLDVALRNLEAAVTLQDALPYMEPPYWCVPGKPGEDAEQRLVTLWTAADAREAGDGD